MSKQYKVIIIKTKSMKTSQYKGATKVRSRKYRGLLLATLIVVGCFVPPAYSQEKAANIPEKNMVMDVLKGDWVRPDGGYTIAIKSISANGQIEAMYYNPNTLPFAKAQASKVGETLRANFELRAGGYAGSSCELNYDPLSDQLKGAYYQAVAKQKYDIFFVRK